MRATPCLHGGTRPLITRTRTHTHNGTAGAHGVVCWLYRRTLGALLFITKRLHTHCTSHSFNPNHPPTHPLTFSKTFPLTHLNELYLAYTRHETALHHTLHHTAPHPHPHHTPTIYCTNYNCHTTPHHTTQSRQQIPAADRVDGGVRRRAPTVACANKVRTTASQDGT